LANSGASAGAISRSMSIALGTSVRGARSMIASPTVVHE